MPKKKTTKKKTKKKATKRKAKVNKARVGGLVAKQWAFCREYLIDLNVTQAAKRAGYSEKTSGQIGHQLIQDPRVVKEIEKLIEERAKRCGVHADRALYELACVAFSDITDCLTFSEGGVKVKTSTALPEKVRRAVGEVKESINMYGGTVSIKMHNKIEALKVLAQHLGMTKQQIDHNVSSEVAKVMFFPSNGREIDEGGNSE